ncbi:hypothetical protein SOASR030_07450 [Leminorella grimontii]|uniref:Uncharacterized protein n=1 Tax=Leminorella grimontii TaxID=82981 RepID=A0AAV5MZC0_9GAMM|nr:hypothetical protein [Leminorella grimontii]KFC96179.1 hypothetical protein GLGR_1354 [Leminorella grimontii ATCC 33999 = DSM 5078]GKX54633.1 hypothetical protein SOASR030_07450 [Leminorella grimontii]GKX58050.1 hypothetical protein SOASR031_03650 [Leminorella grimontii]
MIKAEFGIIDKIDASENYDVYEPEKYHCVYIDDDVYINDWWEALLSMKTYFHSMSRPSHALARWGITIIPPESLAKFQQIVLSDRRLKQDPHLMVLAEIIQKAIDGNKHMIHFGV